MDSSRLSAGGGKRPRDRDALRVAVRVRPLIEREQGSRAVACEAGEGRMVVVDPKKFKASADVVSAATTKRKGWGGGGGRCRRKCRIACMFLQQACAAVLNSLNR